MFGPPLVVAVVLHEIAHGYVAYLLGDPTAKSLRRLSLNPFRHVDLVMTILLPGVLILSGSPVIFGGAKPVPVDASYFRNPRRGMMLVALAGPLTNFVIAILCYIALQNGISSVLELPLGKTVSALVTSWLVTGVVINLVLGIFNLIPIPPLDGGRIAVGLLPIRLARGLARVERYGLLIVIALLFSGLLDSVIRPLVGFIFNLMQSYQ